MAFPGISFPWAADAEWYGTPGWKFRQKITIPAAGIVGTHTNFPVFVNLADLDPAFFLKVRADGGDIRVTAADGTTELAREVVFVDTASKTGELHFKAPVLSAGSREFYIYFGNASATDYAQTDPYGPRAVWSNGYVGVWHSQTAGAGAVVSSTENNPGSTIGGVTTGAGYMGGALHYDGASGSYVSVPHSSLLNVTGTELTMSAWVRPTAIRQNGYVFNKRSGNFGYGMGLTSEYDPSQKENPSFNPLDSINNPRCIPNDNSSALRNLKGWAISNGFTTLTGSPTTCTVATSAAQKSIAFTYHEPTQSAINNWNYFVTVYNGTTVADPRLDFYWNSVSAGSLQYKGPSWQFDTVPNPTHLRATTADLYIGVLTPPGAPPTSLPFQGAIDEIRISSVARSQDWIATEYNNQSSPEGFIEPAPIEAGVGVTLQDLIDITPDGDTLTLTEAEYQIDTALILRNFKSITIVGLSGGTTIRQNTQTGTQRVMTIGEDASCSQTYRLTNLIFTGGRRSNANGGGLYVYNGCTVVATNIRVQGNRTTGSGAGGGIYNDGNLTLINSLVGGDNSGEENNADSFGGGIYADAGSQTTLDSTQLVKNISGNSGGGLQANTYLRVLNGSVIRDNVGTYAGAILAAGDVLIDRTTIRGNSATLGSGGLAGGVLVSAGTAIIRNTLITGNTLGASSTGGGLYNNGATLSLVNSTVYGNTATTNGGVHHASGTTVISNSIIWGNNGGQVTAGQTVTYSIVQGGYTGTGNSADDPAFANTAAHDFTLLHTSPAVHSADTTAYKTGGGTLADVDLAGNARFQGGRMDRGAYESPYYPPANTAIPTIGGTAATGSELSVNDGTWIAGSPAAGAFTYEWLRCTGPAEEDCTPIDDATADTYTLTASDIGAGVRVRVTAANGVGAAVQATSALLATGLQALIDAAPPTGGVIELGAGTEYEISTPLTIPNDKSITIRGDSTTPAIIKQTGADQRVLTIGADSSCSNTVTLEGLAITGGRQTAGKGAGLYVHYGCTVALNNSRVYDNQAGNPTGEGGGIYNAGTLTLNNSQVGPDEGIGGLYNLAGGSGGGIHNIGALTLNGSRVIGNSSSSGGGIFSSAEGTVNVVGSVIHDNWGAAGGGLNAANLVMDRATVSENHGTAGAGIYLIGDATIRNSLFVKNTVGAGAGGGISQAAGTLNLVNSTFSENIAGIGRSVYAAVGTRNIHNSILWGAEGSQLVTITGTTTATYNIIRGGFTGTGNIDADPLFADTAANNFSLTVTSPAIHAGDDAAYTNAGGTLATDKDLADSDRHQLARIDIGAYESAYSVAANTVLPSITGTSRVGQELTAVPGSWAGVPTPTTFSYQWLRCSSDDDEEDCVEIASATASTYTLDEDDATSWLRVRVTPSDGAGTPGSASSAATVLVLGDPTKLVLAGPSSVVAGVVSGVLTVKAQDASNNGTTVTGATVLDLSSTGGATFYSDAGGTTPVTQVTIASGDSVATFYYRDTVTATPQTITVTWASGDSGLDGESVTHDIEVTAAVLDIGAAGTLLTGTNTTLVANGADSATLTVQLKDAFGNNVSQAGVEITFATTLGTFNDTIVTTDASGTASVTLTSTVTGIASVTATVTDPAAGDVTNGSPVDVTFVAGLAKQLTIETEPSATAQSGVPFGQQPVIQLRDSLGNIVTDSGVTVTASLVSGSGTLNGTVTANTDSTGVATFTDLAIIGATGNYLLAFSATDLIPDTSATVTLSAGASAQLTITTQPSATAQNGIVFAQQPVVQVQDAAGNTVTASGIEVTASIASGNGTLSGTTTVLTDANGAATFTNLRITGTLGARTLQFAATGLDADTSATVTIIARDLQAEIDAAAPNDTITLEDGITYDITAPLVIPNDKQNLTILGLGDGATIAKTGNGRVLTVGQDAACVNSLMLQNLTMRGGNANGSGSDADGGGLYVYPGCSVSMNDVGVTENNAGRNGGGIYNAGTLSMLNVGITNNEATGDGGGLYSSVITLWIGGINIAGNTAGGNGGGWNNTTDLGESGAAAIMPNLVDVILTGNSAQRGAGLYMQGNPLSLRGNPVITNNSATIEGGGVYVEGYFGGSQQGTALILNGGTVSGNQAPNGGGIFNRAIAMLFDAEITGNQATGGSGGAVYSTSHPSDASGENSGWLALLGGTLQNNSATVSGGALYHNVSIATVRWASFSGNTAPSGSAVFTTHPFDPADPYHSVFLSWNYWNADNANPSAIVTGATVPNSCPDVSCRGSLRVDVTGSGDGTLGLGLAQANNLLNTAALPLYLWNGFGGFLGRTPLFDDLSTPLALPKSGSPYTWASVPLGLDFVVDSVPASGSWFVEWDTVTGNRAANAGPAWTQGGYTDLTVDNANIAQPVHVVGVFSTTSLPANDPGAPPVVVISGIPMVGDTLRVTEGDWEGGPPPTFTYQWLRCTSEVQDPAECVSIGSATDSAYTVTGDDTGQWLRIAVTGTNIEGSATAYSVAVGPVTGLPDTLTLSGPASVVAGAVSTAMTLRVRDVNDVVTVVSEATLFDLSSTDAAAASFFSDPAGTTPITQATVAAGDSVVVFYYRNTKAGSQTVTATWVSGDAGLDGKQATLDINVGVDFAFADSTSAVVPNGTAGEPTTVTIMVRDTHGNPVTGWADSLAVTITGANDTTVTVTDNSDGTYTTVYTPLVSGMDTVAITLANSAIAGSPFESEVSASAASVLAISTEPSSTAQSGITFAQQPVIQLRDSLGNVVSQAGVEVTATIASGTGTLDGTATVNTDANGVATFTDLAIAGAAGNYTLAFSATSLVPDTSAAITLSAGLANADSTTATVPNGTAGASTTIVVTVRDATNNPVIGWADSLAITITGANDTTVTVTDNSDGTYTAVYTPLVSGMDTVAIALAGTAISGSPFESEVSAAAAAVLAITTEPSTTAQSGIMLAQQPVIQLRDSLGNAVSQAGVEVTAAIVSGSAALGGTTTANTDANGVATFTDLSIAGSAGTYTLVFSGTDLAADTSAAIVLSAGLANADSTTATVPNGTAGELTTLTVTVLDGAGNPVTGWADSLAIAISGANDTTVTATDNGDGTYTAAYTPLVSGTDTVAITLAGDAIAGSSFESVVSASAGAVLAITTQPSAAAQSGIVLAQQPVIQLRDSLGNAVSQAGVEVTATIASGGGALGGTTTVNTDAAGVATFTGLEIAGPTGNYTLAFSAASLAPDTSTAITLAAGFGNADSTSAVVPNGTAGMPTTITVTVRDGTNNPVAGWADSLAITITGANDTTVTVTDNSDGTYTAVYTPLVSGTDTVAIMLAGDAITGSSFESIVSAAAASALAITTQPSISAQSGITLAQQPVVQIRDSLGNAVLQAGIEVTATIASGSGTLDGTTTVNTDAAGIATFTDLAIAGPAGNYTLAFNATGLVADTSTAVTLSAGFANADSTTAVVPNGNAGTPTTITVTVLDGAGNAVSGWADSLAIAISGANDTTVTVVTDNSDGTYTAIYTPRISGMDTVAITLVGSAITGSPFESEVSAAAAAVLAIGTQPSTSAQNSIAFTQQPVVQLRDSLGNAVAQAGVEVTASLISGSGTLNGTATVNTDASGVATFSDLSITGPIGTYTLLFSATGLTADTSTVVTLAAGFGNADSTSATVPGGMAGAPTTITITVRDDANNPVIGWADSLAIAISGANDTTVTVTDNSDGTYTAVYTPLVSGMDTVAITLVGDAITGSPFESAVSAAAASALAVTTQPSAVAQSGIVLTQQPVVQLRDSLGNAVVQAGVEVTAAIASGSGTLNGTVTINTDANGVATFANLAIVGATGSYTLAFDATGLAPDTSAAITLTAGIGNADSTTAVVPNGTAGAPTTLTVTVRDAANNPITGWADSLAVVIGGANDTTVTVTDNSDGTYTAVYTPLMSGMDTVAITLAGAPISGSPFESAVSAAAGAALVITTEPSITAQSGILLAQQPIIQLRDSLGNAVPQAGVEVTAAIASGSGNLGGTATVNTDANGVATFTDLSIAGSAGSYTLAFSATGLASDTSIAITLSAGLASADSTSATVPNGTAGVPTTITIAVADGAGNPVAGWADSLIVTITGANDTTITVTDNSDGTYTAIYTPLVSGTDTAAISLAGTAINGSPFESEVSAAAAAALAISTQPSASAQSSIALAQQPVVQLRDSLGNVVAQAGVEVTAALLSGSGTVNGTTVVNTDASGVATFTDLSITGPIGNYTLAFSATGLAADTSTAITLAAGLGNADSTSAAVPSGIAGLPTTLTVTVRDAANNPITGWADSLAIAISGANDTTVTVTDNSDGTYTAVYTPLVSGMDTVAITLAGDAIAGSPFESAVSAAAASVLTVTTQPSAVAQSGIVLTQQPAIQLRDSLGNTVPQAGIEVTATIVSGVGTLSGAITANTDVNGVATFTDLAIAGAAGNYTLAFSATGLISDTSTVVTLSAGIGNPDSTTATVPNGTAGVPTTITITVADGAGNPVAGWADSLAVAISGANDTTVSVTDNSDGTYTAVYTPLVSGADTVVIALAGTAITGSPFESTVGAASASALTITTQPSSAAQSGAVFAQQPVIQVRDSLGNIVSQAGIEITAAVASGSGALIGTATANTDANGSATFTGLAIAGTAGSYTLVFSASGLVADTSTAIVLTAGLGDPDSTAALVPNGTAGAPTTITVMVRDGAGNAVTGWADSLAIVISGANDTTVTVTDNGDGTYTATYTPLLSGTDTIAITLAGNAIAGSPFESDVNASAASVLAITTQPSAVAQSGIVLTQQPVVQLRDSLGNVVMQAGIGVTATIVTGSGTLGGTATVNTDANGVATFTDLAIAGPGGNYTLAFSATGLAADTSTAIVLGAGLAIADSTTATVPDGIAGVPTTITVTVRDGAGNAVTGWADSLAIAITGANDTTVTVTDNSDGTYTAVYTPLVSGADTAAITLAGAAIAGSPFESVVSAASASAVAIITQPSSTAQSGAVLVQQPVVQLRDSLGNAVSQSGLTVTAAVAAGTGVLNGTLTANTDANGVATFTDLAIAGTAGSYTLVFSVAGLASDTSTSITLVAGVGDADSTTAMVPGGIAGAPTTITITVRDGTGNPVAGWADSLAVVIAGANDTTITVTDNGNGTYTAAYTPLLSGADTVTITLAGNVIAGAPFESLVTASAAATLAITTQPSPSAQSGIPFAQQPVIQLRDSLGNTVLQPGVAVTATIASGSGTLNGTTTVNTDASGIAVFTNLGIAGAAGNYTLAFGATDLVPDTSASIAVSAGVANADSTTATVPAGTAGTPTTVTVTVLDGTGNPVTGWADSLAITITGVNDTTVIVTDNGDGTYTATYIPTVIGTDTVAITLAGTPIANSPYESIVSASGGSALAIATQPSPTAQSGIALAQQPAIQVRDNLGNPVAQSGIAVTAAIASGTGTLGGTITVNTNTSGIATFTDLSIAGAAGNYTLAFSATGLLPDTSTAIALNAGIAAADSTTANVPDGTAGRPTTVTITVRDNAGNPVTGWADSLSLVVSGANDTTLTVTDNGDGTYSVSYLPLVSGADTIAIALAGQPIANSPFITTVSPGNAAVLAITAQPSTMAQSGFALLSQPAIQLRDTLGNPVAQPGVAVTAAIANGSGTLSGTATVSTNAAGVATFTNLIITGAPGSLALAFTATGLTPDTSAAIALVAGVADPGNTAATIPAGTAGAPTTVTITVQDGSGNLLSGWGDSLAITITGANDTTIIVTDNGDGTYSATYFPVSTGTDTLVITLNGVAISGSPYLSTVSSAAATHLMITTQPSLSAQSGVPFAQQPVIQLHDSLGNAVLQAGIQITASIATGGGVLGGTTTAITDAAGQATFADLRITGTTGTRTLAFAATGMTTATSQPIAITAGIVDPANTVVAVPPGLTGQPTIITVTARDASGNPIGVGGATVMSEVTGANSITPTIVDNNDGTYTVTYTPNAAGQDTIVLTLNGTPVQGSPFVSNVELDADPPGPPTGLITVTGDQQVTLSWSAPATDGGAPITDYVIQYSTNSGTSWTNFPHPASTATTATVAGLTNNRPYMFRIAAVNAVGTGAFSAPSAPVIPAEPIPMPTGDLPEPGPGESFVMIDGSQQPVVLEVVGDTALRLRGTEFAITLASISVDGAPAPISSVSTILYLKQGSFIRVSGHGFAPGTVVSVWIFSTPRLLGQIPVANDGTFSGLLPVPNDVELGPHTIQANGLDASFAERSASVGVIVVDPGTSIGTADLAFEVIASDTTPTVGDTITITVKIRNIGTGPATDLVITRELADKRLDRKSVIVSQGSIDTVTNEWRIGRLEAGATATMTIRAVVVIPQEDNEGAGP